MTDRMQQDNSLCDPYEDEEEVDFLKIWKVIWADKKLIIWIVLACTLAVAVISLFLTNIYTARAVLKPASQNQMPGKFSALALQYSGIASLAGIATPSQTSSSEIVSLLESNILKKEMIQNYQLLPILFPDDWDSEKKAWKKPAFGLSFLMSKLRPARPGAAGRDAGIPDIQDGIRALTKIITVDYDPKDDIITIAVDFPDPDTAAAIAGYCITTLNNHMSSEAKRIALVNKAYLEKQLQETTDSLMQQKIYSLIAEKIEIIMMAEVKEGFAFKVLDPPMAPDRKSKPKRAAMVAVTFFIALFAGACVVLIRERLRKTKASPVGGQNEK
ncbi:MAG: hypothetical protein EG826_15360 [Deltaproteobacteria bacterium]|nr:hypothetical protein [Deltaproteobacteria bacterium]